MAQTVARGSVTPADELRSLLDSGEKRVANVRQGGGCADLLHELDRIAELWPQLEAAGMDLRPEAGRWETLQAGVLRHASGILAELEPCGGLAVLRHGVHPEGVDAAWWRLDEYVAQARRRCARRGLIVAAGVFGAVLLAWFLFQTLFPVDPNVAEALRRMSAGEELALRQGDWPGALAEFQAATAATPDNYDAWLRVGVAQEQLGDAAAAQAAYASARALLPAELDFLRGRAATYLLFGLVDQADQDTQAALAIKNDDAQTWYQAASVYELRGQIREAVDALGKASTYAEQAGQGELTALARYRMGMLMQQMNVPAMDTASPTP